jgi:hypothetical protein
MHEISHNLFIGSDDDCSHRSVAHVIHACKTCHQKALGYRGSLPPSHPSYLVYEAGGDLYLNLVDMERELLPKYTHPIMSAAMGFIDTWIGLSAVLVHCNQGFSRSPAIGLVYMARRGEIADSSYREARTDFTKVFPVYAPGVGISLYLEHNWRELMAPIVGEGA